MKSVETPSDAPADVNMDAEKLGAGHSKKGVDSQASSGPSRQDHLSKRIVDSAVGLSSSAFGSGSLGSLRPEDVGAAGKGSSGPSASGPSSSTNQPIADPGFVRHGVGNSRASRPGTNGKGRAEEAFQDFLEHPLPDVSHRAPTVEALDDNVKWPSAGEDAIQKQERRDGEEVSALLSNPASIQFTDNVDFGSLPAQHPRLRAALLDDQGTPPSTWDNLLNFWPLNDESLSSDKSSWLAQWKDVLTRYNDEVWGELSIDATQAKEEVEAVLQGETTDDEGGLASLRRLRQILGHLRGV